MIETRQIVSWTEANQQFLSASLERIRRMLDTYASAQISAPDEAGGDMHSTEEHVMDWNFEAPSALTQLCSFFGLSPFERDVLLLCAGMELSSSFVPLLARAHGDAQRSYPTFSLALAAFSESHWSALSPSSPLRYWRLLEVVSSNTLASSPLKIDERILHYLSGVNHFDERLQGFVRHAGGLKQELVPTHSQQARKIAELWKNSNSRNRLPVIQLSGMEAFAKRMIASAACAEVGLELYVISADVLPNNPSDFDTLIRLWEREAILGSRGLLLECGEERTETKNNALLHKMMENLNSVLCVSTPEKLKVSHRPSFVIDIEKPTRAEQRQLWTKGLGDKITLINGQIDGISSQFDLSMQSINAVCAEAGHSGDSESIGDLLWNSCRVHARQQLDGLARCLVPVASWEQLVLPEIQRQTLHEMVVHVRRRRTVYEEWGFEKRSSRGLGITALFSGPSGTGKTMAAEVLANELHLDLYHIDLSQVVSKYIGETEKNLRNVFDAAEASGAVLLFDEADALFGKRSEVKDSHDRYANIEVSYLLQRMESYRGLAILTTNLKNAIDEAFQRRIRFMVSFPFPDASLRAEIWRSIFPPETPLEGIDVAKLASLNATGGMIQNIALHAAFLAADAGESVHMSHLLRATRSVYARLEKPLTDNETRGWV